MAFNGSGTFVRLYNWVNDRDASIKINSTRMDAEMDGMATALSTCVTKDGQTTTTARVPFAVGIGLGAGTVTAPIINWTADTNTGIYWVGADNIGIAAGGTRIVNITTAGAGILNKLTVNHSDSRKEFSFAPRSTTLAFPVTVLQAEQNNSVSVLEIMPKGTATESPGNGFTWIDLTDVDLQANDALPCKAARVAMLSTGAQFGSAVFNGAASLPVEFIVDQAIQGRMTGSYLFQVGHPTATPVGNFDATNNTIHNILHQNGTLGQVGTQSNHALSIITNNTERIGISAAGLVTVSGASVTPASNDGSALGTSSLMWSDLFIASGGVINFNNGDVTVTHSANTLTFGGASSGYKFDALVAPSSSDGAALGSTALMWSDLFFASGAVVNFDNGDVTLTHSANTLTFGGASSGYKFDALVAPSSSDGAPLGSTSLMWSDLFLADGAVQNWNNGAITLTHSGNLIALSASNASNYVQTFTNSNATNPYVIQLRVTGHAGGAGNYFIVADNSGGSAFLVATNGNVTNTNNSYGAISDRKWKKDIADAGSYIDTFMAQRFRNYRLLADDDDAPLRVGLIAQEAEEAGLGHLLSEQEMYGETGKTFDYGNFAVIAARVLQEHIAETRSRFAQLENR